jgi:hypothetical protein
MATDDAEQIYKQRAATARTVNADARPIAAWPPPRCAASTRSPAAPLLRLITVNA